MRAGDLGPGGRRADRARDVLGFVLSALLHQQNGQRQGMGARIARIPRHETGGEGLTIGGGLWQLGARDERDAVF
jgi:hypothetical protein